MPRPNQTRQVYAETNLAARIASEREAREWSMEGLAKRMLDAGCSINGSAIYKIERADPPRRITVDELVAFSRVFGLSLDDLLTAPEVWRARELAPLLEKWRANMGRLFEVQGELNARDTQLRRQIAAVAADFPDAREFIEAHFTSAWGPDDGGWPERIADMLTSMQPDGGK